MKKRFDAIDRSAVVYEIEKQWKIGLKKIGRWRIYFKDRNGRRYIVIGGDGCQGIDKAIFEEEGKLDRQDTLLIFAEKMKDALRVFSSEFQPFLRAKHRLTIGSGEKQYQFDINAFGSRSVIRQAPSVTLIFLFELPHTIKDRERIGVIRELSQLDRHELLEILKAHKK
jgi:hypothetical protein